MRCVRDVQRAADRAWNEAALNLGELLEAELLHPVLERQVFAERNQMQLVVDRQHAAVVVDDVNRIVGAGDLDAGRQIRRAPCAVASASRVRKNGKADSGQIRTLASRTPVDCGPDARSDNVRYFCITSALAA